MADPKQDVRGMRALTLTEHHKIICLNFSGKELRTPVKNALKVCQAFEMDFYVDGGSFDNYMTTDAFVPAWMVQLAPPEAHSGKKRGKTEDDDIPANTPP